MALGIQLGALLLLLPPSLLASICLSFSLSLSLSLSFSASLSIYLPVFRSLPLSLSLSLSLSCFLCLNIHLSYPSFSINLSAETSCHSHAHPSSSSSLCLLPSLRLFTCMSLLFENAIYICYSYSSRSIHPSTPRAIPMRFAQTVNGAMPMPMLTLNTMPSVNLPIHLFPSLPVSLDLSIVLYSRLPPIHINEYT